MMMRFPKNANTYDLVVHPTMISESPSNNKRGLATQSLMLALGSVGGAVHVSHKLATRKIKSVAEHFFDDGRVGRHRNGNRCC